MNTGTLIAIVIGLLILLAIAWFMTRAGRARAEARYAADARTRAEQRAAGTVTASVGVATAASQAPAAVPAHAGDSAGAAASRDGASNFAGVSHQGVGDAVADGDPAHDSAARATRASDGSTAAVTGAVAAAAAGAAGVAAAGTGLSTSPVPDGRVSAGDAPPASRAARGEFDADNDGHPLPDRSSDDGGSEMASGAFNTADVPFENTDGEFRSQGGAGLGAATGHADEAMTDTAGEGGSGAKRVAVAAASPAPSAAPPVGDGGAYDATRGGEAMTERPRFDPSIDGHPVPGDDPVKTTAASAAPGQPAADRANPPVAETAGTLQGSPDGHGTMNSPDMGHLPSARPALEGDYAVDTGDAAHDVREMMKILNLREQDAERLALSREQFAQLWQGERGALDDARLASVADALRRMIR